MSVRHFLPELQILKPLIDDFLKNVFVFYDNWRKG